MKLIVLLFVLLLSSCAQLAKLSEDAAEKAGKAIKEYCQVPEETRLQFREKVAKAAAPHSAQINCVR